MAGHWHCDIVALWSAEGDYNGTGNGIALALVLVFARHQALARMTAFCDPGLVVLCFNRASNSKLKPKLVESGLNISNIGVILPPAFPLPPEVLNQFCCCFLVYFVVCTKLE